MNSFAEDIAYGLSSNPKFLQTKYLYDDHGSRIFQQIMKMPEYYPTDCEYEILKSQSNHIVEHLDFDGRFKLIELGSGDGQKTMLLLQYLSAKNIPFTYVPIDISAEAIHILVDRVKASLPGVKVEPVIGDYFEVLAGISKNPAPKLLLFMGGNIGNYKFPQAVELLSNFNQYLGQGDKVLVGVDLKKNPRVILNAYDDPHGITRDFNLNLLSRINRELGGEFDLDQFDFYCHYDPTDGEVKSYIFSRTEQDVFIKSLQKQFSFCANEVIATEISKKYALKGIGQLAQLAGFEVVDHFMDNRQYFSDTLLVKTGAD